MKVQDQPEFDTYGMSKDVADRKHQLRSSNDLRSSVWYRPEDTPGLILNETCPQADLGPVVVFLFVSLIPVLFCSAQRSQELSWLICCCSSFDPSFSLSILHTKKELVVWGPAQIR